MVEFEMSHKHAVFPRLVGLSLSAFFCLVDHDEHVALARGGQPDFVQHFQVSTVPLRQTAGFARLLHFSV